MADEARCEGRGWIYPAPGAAPKPADVLTGYSRPAYAPRCPGCPDCTTPEQALPTPHETPSETANRLMAELLKRYDEEVLPAMAGNTEDVQRIRVAHPHLLVQWKWESSTIRVDIADERLMHIEAYISEEAL